MKAGFIVALIMSLGMSLKASAEPTAAEVLRNAFGAQSLICYEPHDDPGKYVVRVERNEIYVFATDARGAKYEA